MKDILSLEEYIKKIREESIYREVKALPESTGRFLSLLTFIFSKGKSNLKIVELGSGIGYSILWFLHGILKSNIEDFEIFGVEKSMNLVKRAKEIVDEVYERFLPRNYGKIYILQIEAENLKGNEFGENVNMLFLDIDKKKYLSSFLKIRPFMKKGSLILAHNVISHKEELEDFLKEVSDKEKYFTYILETDPQGISVSYIL